MDCASCHTEVAQQYATSRHGKLMADGDLNAFMVLGRPAWRGLRAALSAALAEGSEQSPFLELCLLLQSQCEMSLPCRIGDYTDFYAGIHHATTIGKLFRPTSSTVPPTNPLIPTKSSPARPTRPAKKP